MNNVDNNDLTPIEHALKDRMNRVECNRATPCQVYVWGTNSNYTLGTGSQHSRQLPELLDAFHRKFPNVSVKQVCLDKFHFVLVAIDGRVFSCGHGQGGRLGLTTENTVLEPQEIKFSSANVPKFVCAEASIARDHSVFLSESGHVRIKISGFTNLTLLRIKIGLDVRVKYASRFGHQTATAASGRAPTGSGVQAIHIGYMRFEISLRGVGPERRIHLGPARWSARSRSHPESNIRYSKNGKKFISFASARTPFGHVCI